MASYFGNIIRRMFVEENINKNTDRKTKGHLTLLYEFLGERHYEWKKLHKIPIKKLCEYIAEFIINVCTEDSWEYEPSYLQAMIKWTRLFDIAARSPGLLFMMSECFGQGEKLSLMEMGVRGGGNLTLGTRYLVQTLGKPRVWPKYHALYRWLKIS